MTTKTSNIRRKSLFLDANQGETKHDRAFGFIGTNDTDDYQGWFFTWPGRTATIETTEELDSVIESLEADETCSNEPQIPYRFARHKLEEYLAKKFDL